jgi:hypothetical protein
MGEDRQDADGKTAVLSCVVFQGMTIFQPASALASFDLRIEASALQNGSSCSRIGAAFAVDIASSECMLFTHKPVPLARKMQLFTPVVGQTRGKSAKQFWLKAFCRFGRILR